MNRVQRRSALLAVAGFIMVAVLVAAGYSLVWGNAPVESSDSAGYYEVARDLEDFRLEEIHYRPPGFPLWLRLLGFGSQPATTRLVTAGLALHMLGLWLLVSALDRHGVSPPAVALFVAVLVLPPFVQSAAYVLSENLTQLFLVASFSALLFWIRRPRHRYLLLASGALACAALTKPTYQALAPFLAVCLVLTRSIFESRSGLRRTVLAAVFLAVLSTLPVVGFAYFNYREFGRFTVSPGNLAYSLSTKTVKVLERLPDEYAAAREAMIAVRNEELVERGSSHTAEQYYPGARAAVAEVTGLEGRELDGLLLELNLKLIREAPLHYALHVGQSTVAYWFPTAGKVVGESKLFHALWSGVHMVVVLCFLLQLCVLSSLGLFELSFRVAARRSLFPGEPQVSPAILTAYVLALAMIAYTMAVSCLVHHGEPRFRSATDPLIVLSCILGGSIWWSLITSRRHEVTESPGSTSELVNPDGSCP